MGIIERLQRLDERLGLDNPHKRREHAERTAALHSLPKAWRRSLARRRLVVLALIVATVVAISLLVLSLLPSSHDGWVVVGIVLTFIATILGDRVGRRIERNVLAEHRDGGRSGQ